MIVYLILTSFVGDDIRIDRIVYSDMDTCVKEREMILNREGSFDLLPSELYVSECISMGVRVPE